MNKLYSEERPPWQTDSHIFMYYKFVYRITVKIRAEPTGQLNSDCIFIAKYEIHSYTSKSTCFLMDYGATVGKVIAIDASKNC